MNVDVVSMTFSIDLNRELNNIPPHSDELDPNPSYPMALFILKIYLHKWLVYRLPAHLARKWAIIPKSSVFSFITMKFSEREQMFPTWCKFTAIQTKVIQGESSIIFNHVFSILRNEFNLNESNSLIKAKYI